MCNEYMETTGQSLATLTAQGMEAGRGTTNYLLLGVVPDVHGQTPMAATQCIRQIVCVLRILILHGDGGFNLSEIKNSCGFL